MVEKPEVEKPDMQALTQKVGELNILRMMYLKGIYEEVGKEFGEEKGLEIASKVFCNTIRETLTPEAIEAYGLPRNCIGAIKAWEYFHRLQGIEGELTECSPERAVLHEHYCPTVGLWPSKLCARLGADAGKVVSEILNPKMVQSHSKEFMTAGGPFCEVIFEINE